MITAPVHSRPRCTTTFTRCWASHYHISTSAVVQSPSKQRNQDQTNPNPVQFSLPPTSPSQWTLALPLSSLGLQRSISRRPREGPQSMKLSRELPRIVYRLKKRLKHLQFGHGAPGTRNHQSLGVQGFNAYRHHCLKKDRSTPFNGGEVIRFFLAQPLVRDHPHSNHQLPFVQLTNHYA